MDIKEEILMQIAQLNLWTDAYEKGDPIVSDKVWDEHYFELAALERKTGIYFENSPTQKIHYNVENKLRKVKHNHAMLSLAKTKDLKEFFDYFLRISPSQKTICMLKLDGLTCSLRYLNGKLVSAETRGNGEVGEDILHNATVIPSIPKKINLKEELIIDGEIICTYSDFEEFKDEYKNPRNFASGSIRLLDEKECAKRKLTFIPWYVVKGLGNSLEENFNRLFQLGFTIAPWCTAFDEDLQEHLRDCARELGYPIDGLVGRFDNRDFGESLGATGHHNKAAFSLKFYDDEYETELVNIEYEPSRNGQLTPVAIFEPVDSGDSVLTRASMHNLSVMEELLGRYPEKRQTIWVSKMNDIIPQIVKANKNDTPHDHILEQSIASYCPICKKETEIRISDSGVKTLWCVNDKCEGKIVNKLDHMFGKKGFDIKGLSKATFEKLLDYNFIKEPRDVFELYNFKAEWIKKPGFGEKSVSNILAAIEEKKSMPFERVLCATSIPLIGERMSKVLSKQFKDWQSFRDAIKDNYDFSCIDGFGEEMHNTIVNFDYSEIDYIVENYLTVKATEEPKEMNNNLEGIVVCITGKLTNFKNRDELKNVIEDAGGKVVGSVSSKVKILINNDANSQSSKNKAAISAGIPILTEQAFIDTYLKS